jgi:inosose dehydratase
MTRLAIDPLPWYLRLDGWHPEAAPPLPEIYRQIREAGYGAVHVDIPRDMSVAEYTTLLSSSGLAPAPGYLALAMSDDEAITQALDDVHRIASDHAALGLTTMFLSDHSPAEERRRTPGVGAAFDPTRFETVLGNVTRVAEAMSSEGVVGCLHQHVGTWIETGDETAAALEQIAPDLLMFGPDTGHLAWAGCDPGVLIERFRSRVAAVHVKDMRAAVADEGKQKGWSYAETAAAHLWTEPGRGDIDLQRVIAALDGFDGWWVIDVDIADQPTPEDTARVSAQWAAQHLPA